MMQTSNKYRRIFHLTRSTIGCFISLFILSYLGSHYAEQLPMALIAIFATSSIVIFGNPWADFAQPRNVLGGHLLSGIIGVTVHLGFPNQPELACSLAISLALLAMQITRTMHPPGGATALNAILGGPTILHLKYSYLISPILLGLCILLIFAFLINNIGSKSANRYPKYWWTPR